MKRTLIVFAVVALCLPLALQAREICPGNWSKIYQYTVASNPSNYEYHFVHTVAPQANAHCSQKYGSASFGASIVPNQSCTAFTVYCLVCGSSGWTGQYPVALHDAALIADAETGGIGTVGEIDGTFVESADLGLIPVYHAEVVIDSGDQDAGYSLLIDAHTGEVSPVEVIEQ